MAIGRKVSYAFLHLVDSPLILFVSSLLSISAGLYELRAVSVYQLALVPGMVLMIRAVVVPSTAWRTLMLGLAAWPLSVSWWRAKGPCRTSRSPRPIARRARWRSGRLQRSGVQPWSEEDARAWWRTRGERVSRRPERPVDLAHAPTITVMDARVPG